ncbi:hypothetical protein GLOIN_2v1522825 [Rhizophagus irregularis DAOM 181602=DAOM 197198]|uniref:Uncharacterized protein n=1 Tax=Rhizophagus irregularis (strain DAOM 181602 / DAOM 197198 / MUCL 43194) TaxID=747089 RepID=A0A2P4QQQ0_RHIID|nr:hypothetical protein GLOIN_2v1522825 [Rhizophagus irregularis DAOM 181602=DAOM 197198]POG79987.1 hypothetical protein GLOIN_2v1522825 [Rhizophagus irregularis DAOM 181602=DAOM 197198]GET55026.1 hypothetical protein GLOIN_2v1522825 [Rhizophagus irregularis DAOM 181602=DAOM 197198]|eukprot:XP_025186853.1 hypothetical protein GLOIN_2v1522825 [Rhizophagus irregularis DAOM 181602=DAOM 197198]
MLTAHLFFKEILNTFNKYTYLLNNRCSFTELYFLKKINLIYFYYYTRICQDSWARVDKYKIRNSTRICQDSWARVDKYKLKILRAYVKILTCRKHIFYNDLKTLYYKLN